MDFDAFSGWVLQAPLSPSQIIAGLNLVRARELADELRVLEVLRCRRGRIEIDEFDEMYIDLGGDG
jgi:hypothetical protein